MVVISHMATVLDSAALKFRHTGHYKILTKKSVFIVALMSDDLTILKIASVSTFVSIRD